MTEIEDQVILLEVKFTYQKDTWDSLRPSVKELLLEDLKDEIYKISHRLNKNIAKHLHEMD